MSDISSTISFYPITLCFLLPCSSSSARPLSPLLYFSFFRLDSCVGASSLFMPHFSLLDFCLLILLLAVPPSPSLGPELCPGIHNLFPSFTLGYMFDLSGDATDSGLTLMTDGCWIWRKKDFFGCDTILASCSLSLSRDWYEYPKASKLSLEIHPSKYNERSEPTYMGKQVS